MFVHKKQFPSPVHPHACGEHFSCHIKICVKTGSSPRMRGTLNSVTFTLSRWRFIPTHAGNTLHLLYYDSEWFFRIKMSSQECQSYFHDSLSIFYKNCFIINNTYSLSLGKKDINFTPSISCGIRRLSPNVIKS